MAGRRRKRRILRVRKLHEARLLPLTWGDPVCRPRHEGLHEPVDGVLRRHDVDLEPGFESGARP